MEEIPLNRSEKLVAHHESAVQQIFAKSNYLLIRKVDGLRCCEEYKRIIVESRVGQF